MLADQPAPAAAPALSRCLGAGGILLPTLSLVDGRLGSATPFTSRDDQGKLIGPFNAFLHAPEIAGGFLDFHEAEERGTPLSRRFREIVILSVGAVWQAPYELYAHRAVAAKVGFSMMPSRRWSAELRATSSATKSRPSSVSRSTLLAIGRSIR